MRPDILILRGYPGEFFSVPPVAARQNKLDLQCALYSLCQFYSISFTLKTCETFSLNPLHSTICIFWINSVHLSGLLSPNQFKMAPIGDDASQTLHDLVNKLESRVKELEDKLAHAAGGPAPSTSEGVRMILMGPPGAGMYLQFSGLAIVF